MKIQPLAVALTVVNLVLLLLIATQAGRATAQTVTPILRGGALELVDDSGQVRSRLNVESTGGVVLRLLDKNGTIRVKLGAGEDGSGLLLLDEATEPGIHIIARRTGTAERPTTTSVTLRGTDGQQRVIKPCRQTKRCTRPG
jgi:hypothetical protein